MKFPESLIPLELKWQVIAHGAAWPTTNVSISGLTPFEVFAIEIGARIYAEKPRAFVSRMQGYWEAWRPASDIGRVDDQQLDLTFEATSGAAK